MKYVNCPQCNNKIIDRTPLKCLYCGYDSMTTTVDEERIEPLEQPKRPKRENYTIIQSITLLLCIASAIAFLITFLMTKATVVDGVLIEAASELSTLRVILGIVSVLSFVTFVSSIRNYEEEQKRYSRDVRRVKDINYKIECGATRLSDFDEDDMIFIMNMQEQRKNEMLNQKSSSKYYY